MKQEFWNSTALNQSYLLNNVKDGYLATIVDHTWTQMDLLFDGAFNCAKSGNFDNALPFAFAANGAADFTCMSKLNLCFQTETCPIAPVNGVCPYTACPNWPH